MKYRLYNETLCPKVWNKQGDAYIIDDEVRTTLEKIAEDFVKENIVEQEVGLDIEEIILVGSLANYNWTMYSDFDLHIVVDMKKLAAGEEEARLMFDSLRSNWNKSHDIKIKGHDVEIYVQDVNDAPHSMSSFSISKNEWIKEPKKVSPDYDKEYIKKKHKTIKKKIDDVISQPSEESVRKILTKLYEMRQAGLDKKGEFSEENIVFKILRAQGYLDKLKELTTKLYDKSVTVNESTQKQIALHVTRKSNLSSIRQRGLVPNSPSLGQEQQDDNGVYFFPNEETLRDGWDAWLDDFFDDDEEVVILHVDITDLPQREGGDYEIIVSSVVPPERIVKIEELL